MWECSGKGLVVRWHTLGSTVVLFQVQSCEEVSKSTVRCELNGGSSILQWQEDAHGAFATYVYSKELAKGEPSKVSYLLILQFMQSLVC